MEVATIKGATHNPGAPANWTPSNGPCGTLPIRLQKDTYGNPECVSAWKPSPEEIKTLSDGGFILLKVVGWQVPVWISVADQDAAKTPR
ncbi:hypothetical protein NKI98_14705 [Mesorhizobium sp. M0222]|uniref:hypothetical protein n=1 Tax=Mesorhizobium sp. M0222 TaxID=2956921 RepID=UPI003337C8CD